MTGNILKSDTYESLRKSSMPGGPSPPRRRLLLLLCEPESAGPEPLFPAAASSVSPPMTRVVLRSQKNCPFVLCDLTTFCVGQLSPTHTKSLLYSWILDREFETWDDK